MINNSDRREDRTGRLIFEDYQLLTDCWLSWQDMAWLPVEVGSHFDCRNWPYKYKYIEKYKKMQKRSIIDRLLDKLVCLTVEVGTQY